jgi:hypothetical protein
MDTLTATLQSVKPKPADSVSGRGASPSPASSPAAKKPNFYNDLKDNVHIAVGELKRYGRVTPDAVIAAIVAEYAYSAEDWVPLMKLFLVLYDFRNLGPLVIENTLNAMHRMGQIDIWWNLGDNPMPKDYQGERPRAGLFRMAVDFVE